MRTIPETSLDTLTLENMLRALPIGGEISYLELSVAIGRDVQGVARGNLQTARRRLLHRDRVLFGVVINEGLKRLDDAGKVSAGRGHVRRAVNQAKQARRATAAVEHFDALPNHLKVEHNIVMAQAGTMQYIAGARGTKKLEQVIKLEPQPLALAAILDAMKPTTGRKS
jgi:hypothetical protein